MSLSEPKRVVIKEEAKKFSYRLFPGRPSNAQKSDVSSFRSYSLSPLTPSTIPPFYTSHASASEFLDSPVSVKDMHIELSTSAHPDQETIASDKQPQVKEAGDPSKEMPISPAVGTDVDADSKPRKTPKPKNKQRKIPKALGEILFSHYRTNLTDLSQIARSTIPVSKPQPNKEAVEKPSEVEHNTVKLAWYGIEQLLQRSEKFLDGTTFKTPIAVLNTLIDIANAVVDNRDGFQDRIDQTIERLDLVNTVLLKAGSDVSTKRMLIFSGKLISEAVKLHEMTSRSMLIELLENQADMDNIQASFKRIDDCIKNFYLDITMSIDRKKDNIEESLLQSHLQNWPYSPKAIYNADLGGVTSIAREACTEGTCVDILERIYHWALDTSLSTASIFWVAGQAGVGKSTIAHTVARHFDEDSNGDKEPGPNILGADFFCSRQFEETRRQTNIIPTLVYQLSRHSKSFRDVLLLHPHKLESAGVPDKQMKDLLVDPWRELTEKHPAPPYLIIVDALDEIEGEGGSSFLQDLLKTIDSGHLHGLKFLITSRLDPGFSKLCASLKSEAVCRLYEVPTDTVNDDIMTYLQTKLPALREPQLSKLAKTSDGLFIYAATSVRYIRSHPRTSELEQFNLTEELLASIIANKTERSPADKLYQHILLAAFQDLDDDQFKERLDLLHTLFCTVEQVSPSIAGQLLSQSKDLSETAQLIVDQLHAVLYIKDGRVFWYHASFPDFMFDPSRSNFEISNLKLSCNVSTHHAFLAQSCFRIMKSKLKFNICDLPSSFLFDNEVVDLSNRINENISEVLKYCCRHWAYHVTQATAQANSLQHCVSEFLEIRVLFWIEAMNLLGVSGQCSENLLSVRTILTHAVEISRSLREAADFSVYFTGCPTIRSTPHLYISSLATWRSKSELSRGWKKCFPGILSVKRTGKNSSALRTTLNDHTGYVQSVAFSSDGTRIVSGSRDKSVRVWDASTGAFLTTLNGHTNYVLSVAFSSDGTRIASGSGDKSVRVWDASTGALLKTLNGHTNYVKSVAFSSDDTRIVSGSSDKSVRIWDVSMGALLTTLKGHTHRVNSIACSSDGTRIVSGSGDKSVRVWDASTGTLLTTLNGHTNYVLSVAFSNDGTRIVSGSRDKSVRVWDASTGALLKTLHGHTNYVESVAFSSDGTRIVSGSSDKSVRIWDVSMGALLTTLKGHTHRVNSIACSRDGTRIVSGSWDKSVRVWDASTRALRVTEEKKWAFSSGGTPVVSCPEDTLVLASSVSTECTPVWDYTVHGRHWISNSEHWIIWLPYHKRLAHWVPQSHSDVIDPHACLVISRQMSTIIDFTNSKMGQNWAICYSSSPASLFISEDGYPTPGSDSDSVHRDIIGRKEGNASASISANISGGIAIIGDSNLESLKPKAFSPYITADQALAHISAFELPLCMAFANIRFEGDYKVQVGFNESMLQKGVLVEEIYLLLEGTLQVSEDEARAAFAPVFAPFPGTIYTQDKTYYLPVDPQDQSTHPFLDLSTMSGVVTANGGHSAQGGGGEDVGSGNGGGNRRRNQEDKNRGVGGGDSGGSGSDNEDDEDDHNNSNNHRSGIPGSSRKGKGARRGARTVDIPFSSSLSFINALNHQVATYAGIRITLDENDRGMFPPPDFPWGGPWLNIEMTELEVSSNSVHQSAYLLSLAQVHITACSSGQVVLLNRSPRSLHAEGNSAKTTNTKNKSLSIGAMLGLNPSGQVGFTMGQMSSTERQVARWDVSSRRISEASEKKTQDNADGALWHYNHNETIFGRRKGWTFDSEHRPSALFTFDKVKPQVQVKVVVFWSSGIDSAHTGFPYLWRRMKEQMPVFANFIHQLAVVVDVNDLKDEWSWFVSDTRKDKVKMEELSASKGPIHFKPEMATAATHSTEGFISTDLKVLITRAIEGRAQLTPAEITETTSLSIQPPSAPLSIEVPQVAESSSLPTPLPSPLPELRPRQRPEFDDPTDATEHFDVSMLNVGSSKSVSPGN